MISQNERIETENRRENRIYSYTVLKTKLKKAKKKKMKPESDNKKTPLLF